MTAAVRETVTAGIWAIFHQVRLRESAPADVVERLGRSVTAVDLVVNWANRKLRAEYQRLLDSSGRPDDGGADEPVCVSGLVEATTSRQTAGAGAGGNGGARGDVPVVSGRTEVAQ